VGISGDASSVEASEGSGCDAEFAARRRLAGDGFTAGFPGSAADDSIGASVRRMVTRRAAQPAKQRPIMNRDVLFMEMEFAAKTMAAAPSFSVSSL
jgi:hypothetical protein